MITRKQWNQFLADIRWVRNLGYRPVIGDQPIVKCDDDAVYTSHYVKTDEKYVRVKYTFEQSVEPYMTLNDLYAKVKFTVSLGDICRGQLSKEICLFNSMEKNEPVKEETT